MMRMKFRQIKNKRFCGYKKETTVESYFKRF